MTLHHLTGPVSRTYMWKRCPQNPVSNIPELLLTGLTSNPHFKTKCTAVSAMSFFAAIYLIYTKWINPKFATESECNHIYIHVSFSMRMLHSDIWSRSNFWVTVHASWVLMSVKQLIHSPIYRLNHSLLLQMLVSFARCYSDDICGPKWHLKCPRNFRLSPWISPIKLLLDCH